jgi:hypothetical protein
MVERKKLSQELRQSVLTEAGYRCAVPTCRNILAIDLHHIEEISESGPDKLSNLIALCPTCHALFHRNTITRESIYSWKAMLVSLSQAFDIEALDNLLFLEKLIPNQLALSGDGVLKFSRLIAADLASFKLIMQNGPMVLYDVQLSQKGRMLVDAWKIGNRQKVEEALTITSESKDA